MAQLGGQGAFVKEVQLAVLDGRADLAVHSAKDLPSATPPGPRAGVRPRAAPTPATRSSGATLEGLPAGRHRGDGLGAPTGPAGVAAPGPDLLRPARQHGDPTGAGPRGGGRGRWPWPRSSDWASPPTWPRCSTRGTLLPQVGQGALAVECRDGDRAVLELLAAVDDPVAHSAVLAERAFWPRWGEAAPCRWGRWRSSTDGGALLCHRRMSWPAATGGSCCVTRLSGPLSAPAELGRRLSRVLLDDCGGRSLDDWAEPDEVAPGPPR